MVGILAAVVWFVMLIYLEVSTVPGLISQQAFHEDPSARLGVGFLMIPTAIVLPPLDVIAAILLGRWA